MGGGFKHEWRERRKISECWTWHIRIQKKLSVVMTHWRQYNGHIIPIFLTSFYFLMANKERRLFLQRERERERDSFYTYTHRKKKESGEKERERMLLQAGKKGDSSDRERDSLDRARDSFHRDRETETETERMRVCVCVSLLMKESVV